jgi:hypothetical protein
MVSLSTTFRSVDATFGLENFWRDSPTLFLRVLEFLNVEVYPDPVQQRPIAYSERFEATEEPAVFSFRVSYSERCLAGSPGSIAGRPHSKRLFMIVGMYQLDVGVPGDTDLHSEPKRIILGAAKVSAYPSFTNVRVPDGNAYRVYAGIVLSVFRNCAANDGSCPEAQSIFDLSVRSASCCEGIAMRAITHQTVVCTLGGAGIS